MTKRPQSARLRRVPGIDGLRGLAVIAVVLYHFFKPVFHGGFLGVDVFFVLSGFLITSLLIREQASTGRVSLKYFWVRRVRRILPAAFTVMAVVAALTLFTKGDSRVGLGWQMLSILTFSNNWVQIAQSHSYFADSAPQVFSHYWSLAVEEQFYVIWPLLFVALCALGLRRKHCLVVTGFLGIVSAVLMGVLVHPGLDPTRVYYGTDTHAFGLLLGAFMAFWMSSQNASQLADSWPKYQTFARFPRLISFNSVIALLGLCVLFVVLPDTGIWTYRGGIVLASLLSGVVLYAIVQEIGPANWIFKSHVLRWLGERSFSLYLWHWPLIVMISEPFRMHGQKHSLIAGFIALAITVPLSALWYRYIETPFRRKGVGETFRTLFSPLAHPRDAKALFSRRLTDTAIILAVLVMAVTSGATAPHKTRIQQNLEAMRVQGTQSKPRPVQQRQHLQHRSFPRGDEITALGDSVMLASLHGLQHAFPGIYVNADISRAWPWAPGYIAQMKRNNTLGHFVVLGLGTNGLATPGEIDQIIDEIGPDHIVILVSPYGDRPWMEESRQQIYAAVRAHKNTYLARWYEAVAANPTIVQEDGIHPGEAGGKLYAREVRNALERWAHYKSRL